MIVVQTIKKKEALLILLKYLGKEQLSLLAW